MTMAPLSGACRPLMSDSRVDFPAPFAPTSPVQPGPRSNVASVMIGTADVYENERCEERTAGIATPKWGGQVARRWRIPQLILVMCFPVAVIGVYTATMRTIVASSCSYLERAGVLPAVGQSPERQISAVRAPSMDPVATAEIW